MILVFLVVNIISFRSLLFFFICHLSIVSLHASESISDLPSFPRSDLDGTKVPRYLSGALKGDSFLSYIQENLVPTLHDHDIVIMDNLRCHKVEGVKDVIEKVGAHLLYLPPYSPDFNPIEMMWSKLKSILRKWNPRMLEALLAALPDALTLIFINDILGWFTEAGYSHS